MRLARGKEHESKAAERDTMVTKLQKIISKLEWEEAVIRERMLVP
jgi:hypothetical protein